MNQWTGNPALVGFLAELIKKQRVEPRDVQALSRMVQLLAQRHVRYFNEFPERWQSPVRTLKWGIGDCDDKAILIATCLRSFRIPVRMQVIRYSKSEMVNGQPKSSPISHIYPEAYIKGSWVPLESVKPYAYGQDPARDMEAKGYRVAKETFGDTETRMVTT